MVTPQEGFSTAPVRWYLRFPVSYRDLELMLADRGVAVDHTTVFRWSQAYAADRAELRRPADRATIPGIGVLNATALAARVRASMIPAGIVLPRPLDVPGAEVPLGRAQRCRSGFDAA